VRFFVRKSRRSRSPASWRSGPMVYGDDCLVGAPTVAMPSTAGVTNYLKPGWGRVLDVEKELRI